MIRIAWPRVAAVVGKEWADIRSSTAIWTPLLLTLAVVAVPFAMVVFGADALRELTEDADLQRALALAMERWPAFAALDPLAQGQAFIFQQFLVLVLLVPVQGGLAFASHTVVGDKQARALEPLLATPLTSAELLLGKTLGALIPALLVGAFAVALYALGVTWLARPGVADALANVRTALLVGAIGPLATLIALQVAVIASSRTNDPRTAQQWGTFVILPMVGLMISQMTGLFWLGAWVLVLASVLLAGIWVALAGLSWAIFDRERILTEWR